MGSTVIGGVRRAYRPDVVASALRRTGTSVRISLLQFRNRARGRSDQAGSPTVKAWLQLSIVASLGPFVALAQPAADERRAVVEDRLSGARMLETARVLLDAGPAAQGHPSKNAVRELLVERLRNTRAQVRELSFGAEVSGHGRWQLTNVVASFNPGAPRRVVLGGHWDTRPWADEDPDPRKRRQPTPGANDGVSNSVVLLEVARALDERALPADFGVDIVLFDGEEGPRHTSDYYLGSKHLAPRWRMLTGQAQPEAGVFVDMVGRRGHQIRRERLSERHAQDVNDEVFAIAARRGTQSFVSERGRQISDDHVAFHKEGVPVALLIDINDPNWHTAGDVFANLDGAAMAEVGEVLLAWVRLRAYEMNPRP